MGSDDLVALQEKVLRLIEQNETWRKEQAEKFELELRKRDEKIAELHKTLDQVQRDNKAANGKLDKIIAMLEAFSSKMGRE
ncbi:MAG: hypothetical protein ACP5VS_06880 [Desulfomonilaceae bacterium]